MRPEEFLRAIGLEVRFQEDRGGAWLDSRLHHAASGQNVGTMHLRRRDDLKAYQVAGASLSDDMPTGKGIGTNWYQVVRDHVRSRYGLALASDTDRSSDAERLWRHLSACCGARGPIRTAQGTRQDTYYRMEASTAGSATPVGPHAPLGAKVRGDRWYHRRPGPPGLSEVLVCERSVRVGDVRVHVQYAPGEVRSGTSADGERWEREMSAYYGYIPGTKGMAMDGDAVDAYVAPEPEDGAPVFLVRQLTRDGEPDEEKLMLGWPDGDAAEGAYREHMPDWAFGDIERYDDWRDAFEQDPDEEA